MSIILKLIRAGKFKQIYDNLDRFAKYCLSLAKPHSRDLFLIKNQYLYFLKFSQIMIKVDELHSLNRSKSY